MSSIESVIDLFIIEVHLIGLVDPELKLDVLWLELHCLAVLVRPPKLHVLQDVGGC